MDSRWFGALRSLYRDCDDAQKRFLRERLGYARVWSEPTEIFAANWTEARPWLVDPDAIVRDLAEIAEAGARIDYRDALCAFCPLYHAAILIGADPDSLFETAALRSSSEAADLLRGFSQRSSESKWLGSFGYAAERHDGGRVWIISTG